MSDEDTVEGGGGEDPTVLVVDDEQGLADLYTIWLNDDYAVRTAYSGEDALAELDAAVDIVLLDRQMPDVSGDEVLDTLRERDLDCRVAMVTAVEPELDIIGLGFDDYLRKPVDKETLLATVERLLRRSTYDDAVRKYFSASRKHALLGESEDPSVTGSAEFAELESRLDELRENLDDVVANFGDEDYEVLFRRLDPEDGDDE